LNKCVTESKNKKSDTTFIQLPDLLLEFFLADMRSGKPAADKLNTTDFMVYLIHLKNFNPKHQYSWISNETIAKKMDQSSRSIGNSISKLMKLGYIYRFKPSEAHRKKNSGLHDSYCTRPLVRMLNSKEPIIDEREEYKEQILNEIRKNQKAADLREFKKSKKYSANEQIEETPPNEEYLGDDVPF